MFVLVLFDCMYRVSVILLFVISSVLLSQLHREGGGDEDGSKALYSPPPGWANKSGRALD